MPDKVRTVMELAEQTARRMTGSGEQWMSFLTTAARLYKYPYQEQLLIYAQRPEATACATYELWNRTMRRYVRRGAKGIALLDTSGETVRLRYVFDVADTGQRAQSRSLELWQLTGDNAPSLEMPGGCWRTTSPPSRTMCWTPRPPPWGWTASCRP